MEPASLLVICLSAFVAVFLLLTVLALLMRLITAVFVYHEPVSDAAVVAAITTVISNIFPGSRITNIEEKR
jgi:hypothetical protein